MTEVEPFFKIFCPKCKSIDVDVECEARAVHFKCNQCGYEKIQ